MTTVLIICAIVVTCSIVTVVLYLLFSFMPRLKQTLNFVEGEAKEAIAELAKTATEINVELRKVGEAIDGLNALMKSVRELNDEQVKPLIDTVNQMASSLNRSVGKIEDIADETNRFAKKSLHLASFYRDKLFVPIIEVVSLWSGLKTAVNSLFKRD